MPHGTGRGVSHNNTGFCSSLFGQPDNIIMIFMIFLSSFLPMAFLNVIMRMLVRVCHSICTCFICAACSQKERQRRDCRL